MKQGAKAGKREGIRWFINNIFIDIDTGEILKIRTKKDLEKRGYTIKKTTQQTKFQNNGKTGIITRTNECQHSGQLELF
jgi:hypothetical protein